MPKYRVKESSTAYISDNYVGLVIVQAVCPICGQENTLLPINGYKLPARPNSRVCAHLMSRKLMKSVGYFIFSSEVKDEQ